MASKELTVNIQYEIDEAVKEEITSLQSALTTAQEENKRLLKIHKDAVDMHNKQIGTALKSCSNLREENKRYKDALESITDISEDFLNHNSFGQYFDKISSIAQSALNGGKNVVQ